MKKRFFFIVTVIIALCPIVLSSCDKDNEPDPKTKTVLITQASWKYGSATVGGAAVPAGTFQACQTDNVLTFSSSGSGSVDEGATKCNAADPQTRTFTWAFQTDETILFVSSPLFTGGSNTFRLVSINESQLIIAQNYTVGATTQEVMFVFLH